MDSTYCDLEDHEFDGGSVICSFLFSEGRVLAREVLDTLRGWRPASIIIVDTTARVEDLRVTIASHPLCAGIDAPYTLRADAPSGDRAHIGCTVPQLYIDDFYGKDFHPILHQDWSAVILQRRNA